MLMWGVKARVSAAAALVCFVLVLQTRRVWPMAADVCVDLNGCNVDQSMRRFWSGGMHHMWQSARGCQVSVS